MKTLAFIIAISLFSYSALGDFNTWDHQNRTAIIDKDFSQQSYAGLDAHTHKVLFDQKWLVGYHYKESNFKIFEFNASGTTEKEEFYKDLYHSAGFTEYHVNSENQISDYKIKDLIADHWGLDNKGMISKSRTERFDRSNLDT